MAQTGAMISGRKRVTTPGISIYEQSETSMHGLGDILEVGDRTFVWAKNGAGTLTPGTVAVQMTPVAEHQNVLLSADVAVGGRVLAPTFGAAASTLDQYKDGYCCINKATGFGVVYRIKTNAASAGSVACNVTLYDDLEAAVDTTTEVSLVKNKYDAVIMLPTGAIPGVPLGVPLIDVTISYYFWLQVSGPAAVLCDTGETLVIGETCGAQDTVEVAGAVGLRDDQTTVCVGNVMYIATAAEYALVDLKLL